MFKEIKIRSGDKIYKLSEGIGIDYNTYFWLENEQHEVMEVREDELFNILDKYFQEEF